METMVHELRMIFRCINSQLPNIEMSHPQGSLNGSQSREFRMGLGPGHGNGQDQVQDAHLERSMGSQRHL